MSTTSSTEKLKPCPFCGCDENSNSPPTACRLRRGDGPQLLLYAVMCGQCGATGRLWAPRTNEIEDAKEQAVKFWNRREDWQRYDSFGIRNNPYPTDSNKI